MFKSIVFVDCKFCANDLTLDIAAPISEAKIVNPCASADIFLFSKSNNSLSNKDAAAVTFFISASNFPNICPANSFGSVFTPSVPGERLTVFKPEFAAACAWVIKDLILVSASIACAPAPANSPLCCDSCNLLCAFA